MFTAPHQYQTQYQPTPQILNVSPFSSRKYKLICNYMKTLNNIIIPGMGKLFSEEVMPSLPSWVITKHTAIWNKSHNCFLAFKMLQLRYFFLLEYWDPLLDVCCPVFWDCILDLSSGVRCQIYPRNKHPGMECNMGGRGESKDLSYNY